MMAISGPINKDSFMHRNSSSPPAVCIIKKENQLHNNDNSECDESESGVHVYPMNRPSRLCATLDTRSLWRQFDALGTEMIVTRRGRRMFPPIKVELHNLNPNSFYVLLMDLAPVDKYRYKYQNSKWVKCFEEACAPTRLYIHPESPALGSYWMDHIVSFYKLKLTNNQLDKQGHIIVNSMHAYQPRLHIVESSDRHNLNLEDFHTITFPGTQFTTVTAYQNDKITQLKIENNPFAKGFRQPMSRNRTRPIKLSYPPQSGSEAGSDDGIVYNGSTSFVGCSSSLNGSSSDYDRRMYLKRSSSGSDDEITTIKKANRHREEQEDDGMVQVTSQINTFIPHTVTPPPPPTTQLPTPVYIVYTNNGGTSPPISTSSHLTPQPNTFVTPQTITHTTTPAYHIVHIPPPPSLSTAQTTGIISPPVPSLLTHNKQQHSYDSSSPVASESSDDSESECEHSSSPRLSPHTNTSSTKIIQSHPPPLISSVLPSQHHGQSIIIPQGIPATNGGYITAQATTTTGHGNGILHTPTQQILVPVNALSQIHGKSSVLLQPLITTTQQVSGGTTNGIILPSSNHIICTSAAGNETNSFIQTLPVIGGKPGMGNFITKPLIANGTTTANAANGPAQTFQLLTLPGRTNHIVDQAH